MPLNAPRRHSSVFALWLAWGVLGALAAGGWQAASWLRMAPASLLPTAALERGKPTQPFNTRPLEQPMAATPQGPVWRSLKPSEQTALAPLAQQWAGLSGTQKRRWLALAQNFAALPEPEQQKLHSRMADWASLSAQQRNQARLNYAKAHRLGLDHKRAQWEAYQALSEEARQALAAKAAPKAQGAAPALRPVPAQKLVQVPAASQTDPRRANPPKILRPAPDKAIRPAPVLDDAATGASVQNPLVETAPVTMPSATPQALPMLPGGNDSAKPTASHDPALPSH